MDGATSPIPASEFDDLGDAVRAWRASRHLSTRKLALELGTTRQSIENLESGIVKRPDYLIRLAELMGLDLRQLDAGKVVFQATAPAAPSPMRLAVAQFVYDCRSISGMTQEQFGARFGVEKQAVSHWEKARSMPDFEMLSAMSARHGVALPAHLARNDSEGKTLGDDVLRGVGELLAESRRVLPKAVLDNLKAPAGSAELVEFLGGLEEMVSKFRKATKKDGA